MSSFLPDMVNHDYYGSVSNSQNSDHNHNIARLYSNLFYHTILTVADPRTRVARGGSSPGARLKFTWEPVNKPQKY
jgi:hypothetical protein